MDNRKWQAAASASAPDPEAAPDAGYPTDGDPSSAVPATIPGAYWFHQVGEEIRKVIVDAGLTPDDTNLSQLSAAIAALIAASVAPAASETVAGILEIATDGEAQAFTANKAIDGAKLNTAFKGSNQSLVASAGYQKLPGGLILQWGISASVVATTQTVTLPLTFPNEFLCLSVTDAGASSGSVHAKGGLITNTSSFEIAQATSVNIQSYWFALGR